MAIKHVKAKDFDRLVKIIKSGKLDIEQFRRLAWGRALGELEPGKVKELSLELSQAGAEGVDIALEIIMMYGHGNEAVFHEFVDTVFKILPMLFGNPSVMARRNSYHLEKFISWVVDNTEKKDELFELYFNGLKMFCGIKDTSYYTQDFFTHTLSMWLRSYPEKSLACFKEIILDGGLALVRLEFIVGKENRRGGANEAILSSLEVADIMTWLEGEPEELVMFIARIMPLIQEEGGKLVWSKIAHEIIDNFGKSENVLREISLNIGSFSWTGTAVTYYQQYLPLFESLKKHHEQEVAKWATQEIEYLLHNIERERTSDEEREFGVEY